MPFDNLKAIGLYIADDNPNRAESFVAELEAKAGHLAAWPQSYPARDDISSGLRAAAHSRYLLLYRDFEDEVRIVRVVHGARDLPQIFNA